MQEGVTMQHSIRGMTLMSFLMILVVVGFFAYIGMRLFPIYTQYYSAVTDMKKVAQAPGAANKSITTLRSEIERYYYVSYVTDAKPKEHIKIVTGPAGKELNLSYEVRSPLIYNLDVIAKFDHSEPLSTQAAP
jgi:Tfp pilus assembly protein PilE